MRCSRGATWISSRSGFRSCTGASNSRVRTLREPLTRPSRCILRPPTHTRRLPRPISWPEAMGTLQTSRAGPGGTGKLRPPGGPPQQPWSLVFRKVAITTSLDRTPLRPMASRWARSGRARMIFGCRAGTAANGSGIRKFTSCRRAAPSFERSAPGRRCYRWRGDCARPAEKGITAAMTGGTGGTGVAGVLNRSGRPAGCPPAVWLRQGQGYRSLILVHGPVRPAAAEDAGHVGGGLRALLEAELAEHR
jgi:hypothetical protein